MTFVDVEVHVDPESLTFALVNDGAREAFARMMSILFPDRPRRID